MSHSEPKNEQTEKPRPTRPLFVEFAGVPASGKTTTAARLQEYCTELGLEAVLMRESTEEMPHRELRGHWKYNAWNLFHTLARLIEVCGRTRVPDVVILDRGVFDAVCWFDWLLKSERVPIELHEDLVRLTTSTDWCLGSDFVFVLDADYQTSLQRRRGSVGFVVNPIVFPVLTEIYSDQAGKSGQLWPHKFVCVVKTDELEPADVFNRVIEVVGDSVRALETERQT